MFYKNLIYFFLIFFVFGCTTNTVQNNNIELLEKNLFSNKGFSLVYNETLYQKKIVSKKLDERGLLIFQKNLKKNSLVKIRNILNNITLYRNYFNFRKFSFFC